MNKEILDINALIGVYSRHECGVCGKVDGIEWLCDSCAKKVYSRQRRASAYFRKREALIVKREIRRLRCVKRKSILCRVLRFLGKKENVKSW